MDIQKQILVSLENNGLHIDNELDLEDKETLLSLNSLQYISFVSDLEQAIGMEIPDRFLNLDNFSTLKELIDGIKDLYENSPKNNADEATLM